ncbi:hypothetical protein AX282_13495 [Bacillus spizizenii]|nr:hypothetical protein AX282_13495 [Bacillus spizizenii]
MSFIEFPKDQVEIDKVFGICDKNGKLYARRFCQKAEEQRSWSMKFFKFYAFNDKEGDYLSRNELL